MIIIGLMSGTAADAIDAALCEVTGNPPALNARLIHKVTKPYPVRLRDRILHASTREARVDLITVLNMELGEAFADAALLLMREARVRPAAVDLIGSHGQTVWHAVESDGQVRGTLQIGEAAVIAEMTGITTINNFCVRDVAAHGQGAPLTAYADWMLLRHPTRWRAVQNIGSIASITFLPPHSDDTSAPVAFDTGPGCVLIDGVVSALTSGIKHIDRDGAMAAAGQVDHALLAYLLDDPYFDRKPPKTTGRELYSEALAADIVKMGQSRGLKPEDIAATVTAFTARSIAYAYSRFAPAPIDEAIIGGGGTRNRTLMEMLGKAIDPVRMIRHEDIGIDGDAKDALVLALMAHETWYHRPANLPALTGAAHRVVLGQITPGRNYPELIRRTWL